jgi:type II secretory pathway pseudopilin PulG
MRSREGFTLIELLFFIAALGILSTIGILFYQQRMQNQKVEKTVAQVQYWLQAAMVYYAQKRHWPKKISELTDPAKRYMPEDADKHNPFCNDKTNQGKACFNILPVQEASRGGPGLFVLETTLLTDDATLKLIASRLPYTEAVEGNPQRVIALTTAPGAAVTLNQDAILVRVGFIAIEGKKFKLVEVPSGDKSETHVMASYFIPPAEQPDCSRYGSAYRLMVYPLSPSRAYSMVKIWRGGIFAAPQQPALSMLSLRSVGFDSRRYYELQVYARPQWLFRNIATGSVDSTGTNDELKDAGLAELRLFFVCKKEGVVSVYDHEASGMGSSGFETAIEEYRF